MTMGDHIDCSFVLSKVLIRILCVCVSEMCCGLQKTPSSVLHFAKLGAAQTSKTSYKAAHSAS